MCRTWDYYKTNKKGYRKKQQKKKYILTSRSVYVVMDTIFTSN